MDIPKVHFDWTFNVGHVLIAFGMLVGTISTGFAVSNSISGQLVTLAFKVQTLEEKATGLEVTRLQSSTNAINIAQLQGIADSIQASNKAMLEQLTGIRVDLGNLRGQLTPLKQP